MLGSDNVTLIIVTTYHGFEVEEAWMVKYVCTKTMSRVECNAVYILELRHAFFLKSPPLLFAYTHIYHNTPNDNRKEKTLLEQAELGGRLEFLDGNSSRRSYEGGCLCWSW